MSMRWAGHVA